MKTSKDCFAMLQAVLLLSQIEEALTAAQSIHSEDPGAKEPSIVVITVRKVCRWQAQ